MTPTSPQRAIVLLLLATLLAVLPACSLFKNRASNGRKSSIALQDCQLSTPGLPLRLSAKCGQLPVYENRETSTGKIIDLNIAVIPAVSRNPAPDPLFFLSGGPGQAATETYPLLFTAFSRINQKREIILVDQRGTGKSNPLICPDAPDAGLETPGAPSMEERLKACLASLSGDTRFYTTLDAAQDLDQVRAALGYDAINLYGVSYGTRLALTYLRQYPTRVRSVILDGVVPQTARLGLDIARDAQNALDLIFQRCSALPYCQAEFPDLNREFDGLLAELRQNPIKVSLSHPVTGELTEITFTANEMADAVRLLSYAPETTALLPLLIHTAYTRQDYGVLASQYLLATNNLVKTIADGLNYSILCAEDVPFFTPQEAEQADAGTYLGDSQTSQLFEICKLWPHANIPTDFKQAVQSDTPVLMLSGSDDPVTPPANAEVAAATLSKSLSLVAPGQGHNVVIRGCIPTIIAQFIDSLDTQGLTDSCVSQIRPLPFFVNFSGPDP
jgi:pimeloyl-ACP methyl ester carboxylesterase